MTCRLFLATKIFKLRARSFYVYLSRSVGLSVCLSVRLSVCLSVCLSVEKIQNVYLSGISSYIWKQKLLDILIRLQKYYWTLSVGHLVSPSVSVSMENNAELCNCVDFHTISVLLLNKVQEYSWTLSVSESVCLFVEKMSKCTKFLRKVEKGPIPQVILEHTYPELSVARATLVFL